MSFFTTEFPIKPIGSRAIFVGQIVAWLQGTSYSTVFDEACDTDLDGETGQIRTRTGEELRLREFQDDGVLKAIGFRHDFPDQGGRLWRTEAIVSRFSENDQHDVFRLRTQCIARDPGIHLPFPKKPYFIKSILQDSWGASDDTILVDDKPVWIQDDDSGLTMAEAIVSGLASKYLPVLYISSIAANSWPLSRYEIEKLAFDLGGVAHVAVEPSRSFSFRLRDRTEGANSYGGTVGIMLPNRGIVRRLRHGWDSKDSSELVHKLESVAFDLRNQMPTTGWDWTELQEQTLRRQRERDRNRRSLEQIEQLFLEQAEQTYQEEIKNLKEKIDYLEIQIAAGVNIPRSEDEYFPSSSAMSKFIGPQIYPGEISDRIRLAAKVSYDHADQIGLDRRSKEILGAIANNLPGSPGRRELIEDLKRATKDPNRLHKEVKSLLLRHGYSDKSSNKHTRLEPKEGYIGLDSITIPKTPSEYRGMKNLLSQVRGVLGLKN